jgi:hypothetical protein
MAGNIFLQTGTLTTLLDDTGTSGNASLTTLATGSAAIPSSAFNNTPGTLGAFWGDFELTVFYGSAPTVGNTCDLYILESVDATNYGDGTAGSSPVASSNHYVGSFVLRAVTTVQRINLRNVPLPATNFKVQLVNNGGQSLAAQNTGSRLKLLPVYEQYT